LKNSENWLRSLSAVFTHKEDAIINEFGFQIGLLSAIVLINNLEQTVSVSFDQLDNNPSITPKTFALAIDPSFDIIK
jgi:hypothetical protein